MSTVHEDIQNIRDQVYALRVEDKQLQNRIFQAVCPDCAGKFPEDSEREPFRSEHRGRHIWKHKDLKWPENYGWPCKASELREIFIDFGR